MQHLPHEPDKTTGAKTMRRRLAIRYLNVVWGPYLNQGRASNSPAETFYNEYSGVSWALSVPG